MVENLLLTSLRYSSFGNRFEHFRLNHVNFNVFYRAILELITGESRRIKADLLTFFKRNIPIWVNIRYFSVWQELVCSAESFRQI